MPNQLDKFLATSPEHTRAMIEQLTALNTNGNRMLEPTELREGLKKQAVAIANNTNLTPTVCQQTKGLPESEAAILKTILDNQKLILGSDLAKQVFPNGIAPVTEADVKPLAAAYFTLVKKCGKQI